jgi:hypothetical protein
LHRYSYFHTSNDSHKMDLQDFSTLFDNRKHLLFNLLLNMLVNFLLLIHNLLSWVTYIQKVARFITGDAIVSVIISTRQDENCEEIPEAVLWHPSRQYLRRKSRDKKRQVNSPVSLASRLYWTTLCACSSFCYIELSFWWIDELSFYC